MTSKTYYEKLQKAIFDALTLEERQKILNDISSGKNSNIIQAEYSNWSSFFNYLHLHKRFFGLDLNEWQDYPKAYSLVYKARKDLGYALPKIPLWMDASLDEKDQKDSALALAVQKATGRPNCPRCQLLFHFAQNFPFDNLDKIERIIMILDRCPYCNPSISKQ